MAKKLTLEEANQKIQSKHKHLTLITFNGTKKACEFIDSEYGEFTSIYRYVLSGESNHPERSKKNKYKKTFEQAFIDLQNRQSHLELITYNGSNSKCLIKDIEFGEFEAIYQVALSGKAIHIERKKTIHKKTAKCENTINKRKNTNLEKYGVESVFQSNVIKNKIKTANLNKYGVEYPQQNADIQQKTKNTNLEKYGVENVFASNSIKEKIKQTNIEKYGVKYPTQNKEIMQKVRQTSFDKGIWNNWGNLTTKEYSKKSIYSQSHLNRLIRSFSQKEIETFTKEKTVIEQLIESILIKHNISYIFDKFEFTNTYKPDFLLTNYNIIIECDGLYFHSDANKSKQYHKKKQEHYNKLGYQSLFFRSDEIVNKMNIVESIILAKIGKISNKIFARKCKIIKLHKKESNDFFITNHLMSKGSGSTYALLYNNEIVSAMRIINKKDYVEISRFCNKLNTYVLGGFSKLLNHIINNLSPKIILSFVDLRYGNGFSLLKCGFVEESKHLSFKWTDGYNSFHRLRFPNSTGYEKGLFKIWDCGQKKFKLNL